MTVAYLHCDIPCLSILIKLSEALEHLFTLKFGGNMLADRFTYTPATDISQKASWERALNEWALIGMFALHAFVLYSSFFL